MFVERRKYPRVSFNFPVKLSSIDYNNIVTETKEISGNGAYCTIDKRIPPMTRLMITLLVPIRKNSKKILKKITCKGIVIREEYSDSHNNSHNYNIAIYFNEIKKSDRKIILSYINSSVSQPA